jgi:uncharacterized protein YjdB
MKTTKRVLQTSITGRDVTRARKFLATMMLPIFLVQMTSFNLLLVGARPAHADEVVAATDAAAAAPEAQPVVQEKQADPTPADTAKTDPAPVAVEKSAVADAIDTTKTEPAPVAPEQATTTDVVPAATPEATDVSTPEADPAMTPVENAATADPAVTEPAIDPAVTEPVSDPATAPAESQAVAADTTVQLGVAADASADAPVVAEPKTVWSTDGSKATTNDPVALGQTYVAPQNDQVTVTFTKLPDNPGTLTIEEIKLSAAQVKSLNAVSNVAYDITSTMADGTFKYELTLPKPKNAKNVEVKYAENVAGLGKAATVSDKDAKTNGSSVNVSLDHFTIFVLAAVTTATQLVFTTQPSSPYALAGNLLATQPVVALQDANGVTDTAASDTITLQISNDPACNSIITSQFWLTGTKDQATVAGVATFTDIGFDSFTTPGTYYIMATSAALPSAIACSNAIAVNNAAPSVSLTPVDPSLPAGTQQQFTAVTVDPFGTPLAHQNAFTWTSSDPTVGTVDANGLFTAIGIGATDINAADTVFGISSDSIATVTAPLPVAPTLAAIPAQTVIEGQTLTFNASANTTNAGGVVAYSLVGAPAGATIDPVTGAFSWTPAIGNTGAFAFDVSVTDGVYPTPVTTPVSVMVLTTNVPVITITYGAGSDVTVTVTDANPFTTTLNGAPFISGIGTVSGLVTIQNSYTFMLNDGVYTLTNIFSNDITPPVITILGNNTETVLQGSIYVDAGATALDNVDGNVTANIITTNTVNTAIIGTYTVTYDVSDANGNAAVTATRTVNVVAAPVLTSINLTPASASLTIGATQQVTAAGLDQFNAAFPLAATTYASDNTAVATVDATGLVTAISAGTANITALDSGITSNPSVITVTAALLPVTVTVNAGQSKAYGAADPAFAYTSSDPAAVFTGALGRATGENVGTYAINQGTLAAVNYVITFVSGNFSITARPITVAANSQTKVFGAADPALTYQVTSGSLVASDAFAGALVRVAGENVGTYAINQGTLALSSNYALTYVGANLTITQANQTIIFGALAAKTIGDPDFSVSATATSGLAVSFTAAGNCTVTPDGLTVHLVAIGSCTITADQAGDGNFNAAPGVARTFAINDVIPAPLITLENASNMTASAAVIAWVTDHAATSRVVYDTVSHLILGAGPDYGYASSTLESDTAPMVTSHSVTVGGLIPGMTYYYRAVSHGSPESVGAEQTFTTPATVAVATSSGGGGGHHHSSHHKKSASKATNLFPIVTTSLFDGNPANAQTDYVAPQNQGQESVAGAETQNNAPQSGGFWKTYWPYVLLLILGGGGYAFWKRKRSATR